MKNTAVKVGSSFYVVDVSTKTLKRQMMFIAMDDWNKIVELQNQNIIGKVSAWAPKKSNGKLVYARVQYKADKRKVFVHRLISDNKAKVIDHFDGDGLDNRRLNLVVTTMSHNAFNAHNRSVGGNLKVGVSIKKGAVKKPYRAYIAGKHLGSFKTFEQAVTARREAEIKMFGYFKEI